jgi:hypothetical protein
MVLPYVHSDPMTMINAAQHGLELGAMVSRLPAAAQENAFQASAAAVAKEHANELQRTLKDIQARTDLTPQQKSAMTSQAMIESGISFSGGQATFDPLGAYIRGLDAQRTLQALGGGPAATSVGSLNPTTPVTTTTPSTSTTPATSGNMGSTNPVAPAGQGVQPNIQMKTAMLEGGAGMDRSLLAGAGSNPLMPAQVGPGFSPVSPTYVMNAPIGQTPSDYYGGQPMPATFLA